MIKRLILSAVTISMLASCGGNKTEETKTVEVETAIPVKVMTLKSETISRTLDYAANLVADEQVYYAPASAGRIDKIFVEVGDKIKKGQILVTMDQSQLKQAEAQLRNLKSEYDRAKTLKATNSISQQAYDAATTQYEVSKANIEFLRENTKMVAPFDGVVTGKYFEDGEVYTGGAFGGASKPAIIAIEKINPLKAYVSISEQYYNEVKENSSVELHNEIFPDSTFMGTVKIVYPTIDPASRTFLVEVQMPNEGEILRPGMYGDIFINVGETNTITVPAISVLKLQGANDRYVFINNKGKAKRVSVKIGRRFEDRIEIISNEITSGTELVVVGQSKLLDGSQLNIVK